VISSLVGVQVVNGLLLPINLFFIWRLARSEELMGGDRNAGVVDWLTAATIFIASALSSILVAVTVFCL
jgi:Mn2+/Fe2+ NRAMP family transporter